MSAWGKNGSARSCEALLKRVEGNDPKLTELVILPMKKFGSKEVYRLAKCLESTESHNLRSLQASGHCIDDCNALEALGAAISHIESIAVGGSDMGDEGVCAFCRGIEANEKMGNGSIALKSIDLSWKNIGKDGLRAILRALAQLPSLQYMDLSRNEKIGPSFDFWEEISSFSLQAPIFPGLTYLDLSDCSLDGKSCATLLRALHVNDSDPDGGEGEKDVMAKGVRNLELKLNSNDLSDRSSSKEMWNLLARGFLVTELYVSKCHIGDEGMNQIVDECCCSSKLKASNSETSDSSSLFLRRLDLSYNNLTSISCLANQLHLHSDGISLNDCHYFSNLRTLDLSGNPLGQSLLDAFDSNPEWIMSLEELDLSHTSCESSGAVELIRRSNSRKSSLKKLNLFGNGLASDGFLELSKVLHGGHMSLNYLDLGGNGATESAVVTLVEVFKNKMENDDATVSQNTLRVLVVGGNKGGAALEKAVKEVQKVHPELDIARDKTKKNSGMPGSNMINNTPGTSWMS